MVICCDTSFLFSVYGNDGNTEIAHAFLKNIRAPISVSLFNGFELANAFRLAEFRRLIGKGDSSRFLEQHRQDVHDGRILEQPCNLAEVIKRAHELSARHTLRGGHRGFDILQVAAALEQGATEFLTFDRLQNKMATGENLNVPFAI